MLAVGDDFWGGGADADVWAVATLHLLVAEDDAASVFDALYHAFYDSDGGRFDEFDAQKSELADGAGFLSVAWLGV